MVELIRVEALLTAAETGVDKIDDRVLAAMGEVPRHEFVPPPWPGYAYLPQPLPVHPEQNIAAPFLVALMTHLARVEPRTACSRPARARATTRRCSPGWRPRSTASS